MGTVIDLFDWRSRRPDAPQEHPSSESSPPTDALGRLDRVVARLDPLLEEVKRERRRDQALETDILAIAGALSLGLHDEAAARAERLAGRLESRKLHPAQRSRD